MLLDLFTGAAGDISRFWLPTCGSRFSTRAWLTDVVCPPSLCRVGTCLTPTNASEKRNITQCKVSDLWKPPA